MNSVLRKRFVQAGTLGGPYLYSEHLFISFKNNEKLAFPFFFFRLF
jgi:hypothetical protein